MVIEYLQQIPNCAQISQRECLGKSVLNGCITKEPSANKPTRIEWEQNRT